MSNPIVYDSLLVHYLARELHDRLAARRLRGVRFDSDARRLVLELDTERIVWELHPTRGWLRLIRDEDGGAAAKGLAAEGWGGRRIRTQRRPRVRRIEAPLDERVLEIEIDAGGPDRAARFVVELMTNQWNALALDPSGTIVSALWGRETGGRTLRSGASYEPPSGAGRAGIEAPVSEDRFRSALRGVLAGDRTQALVRALAWTSPLNAPSILGAVAGGEARSEPDLAAAYERYRTLAGRPDPAPRTLEEPADQPYPLPLAGAPSRPCVSLLAAFELAASRREAPRALAPEVRAALEDRLERVKRRTRALHREAEAAPDAAIELRRRADLLLARLHEVQRGAERIELEDFQGGTETLELDPTLSPAENAAALYDRAAKRERAAERLPSRVRAGMAEQNRLEALLEDLDEGSADPEELARWIEEVRPSRGPSGEEPERLPYRRYRSSGGLEIRVGRSGRANDDLTFHHSAPDDVWLHARDAAGAHVILRWSEDQNPPRRDLLEAAVLAALHSKARTSGAVPVDWTRRKYVRSPRKAPPGVVVPDRVSTVFVEPDPAAEERLRE